MYPTTNASQETKRLGVSDSRISISSLLDSNSQKLNSVQVELNMLEEALRPVSEVRIGEQGSESDRVLKPVREGLFGRLTEQDQILNEILQHLVNIKNNLIL